MSMTATMTSIILHLIIRIRKRNSQSITYRLNYPIIVLAQYIPKIVAATIIPDTACFGFMYRAFGLHVSIHLKQSMHSLEITCPWMLVSSSTFIPIGHFFVHKLQFMHSVESFFIL